ncbi:MAG: glycoside hydrolase/phage tail family protein [Phycisphaerales bacterium]|nr:glycoside hydrolase/phage tail family protein [Hyphomonadaceae bacterium]
MAELVLSTVGQALGRRLPGALSSIGSTLGQVAGSYLGRSIDQQIFGAGRGYEGARLTDLHIQASTEGASLPTVFGRVRIAGQVIWAARFKEHVETRDVGGGGKGGGPRATSTQYRYTLSFAVGLCEGEIARIARVWANGEPFDMSGASMRVHKGGESQPPDALIEAIEGEANAPAYRGLAYVVFEDMALERFGNIMPQLSFEIVRPAPSGAGQVRFEELVTSVCLIPGAGEFVYAAEPVLRTIGPGQQSAENVHAERDRANLLVSLDQLEADFPTCDTVLLVVAWFGNDLRCGACDIRPGVEISAKQTTPLTWRAGGVTRGGAHLVSQFEGAPAFGGTPSDDSVLQAIAELKARGYKVGVYPFLLMDVPGDNAFPDPYGGAAQAAYPWRGRITLHPAAGEAGSPDKTAAAAAQVAGFFGAASPDDFSASGGAPTYAGPDEWSYRRFILHNAKLAALAGGVDAFIIGSELRGLTTARDGAASYPAVAALQALADDVRTLVGAATTLTYAADWSEYFGHQPQDGSNDVFFHLDPLWAGANIDVVGVDWYPPLADWRAGATHLDAQEAPGVHDLSYLQSRIEGGENFDWHYASGADRDAQIRTDITDGAYGEPWVYRGKDLRNFWARAHHDRPGGVRNGAPTSWIAESKPIWLVELGCPAVDKGANAPNLFSDVKSDESALPPFSTGARDDLIQQRTLEAYLRYWAPEGDNNPLSALTDKPMIEQMSLWCWDARPHPAFPARMDVWADGAAWRGGHWLNGRAGLSGLGEVVLELCRRAGVENVDVSALVGAVSGFVVEAPASARAALAPLMAAYDFTCAERDGAIAFFHRAADALMLSADDFVDESAADAFAQRGDAAEAPVEARVRFLDAARDYLIAGVNARRLDNAEGGVTTIEAPLVLEAGAAERIAQRALADARAAAETWRIALGPAHLALEPGDRLTLDGVNPFEIARIQDAETRRLELRRVRVEGESQLDLADPGAQPQPAIAPTPALSILDLPLLPGAESDERPLAAVFASPWLGAHDIYAGASQTRRGGVQQPAAMGELVWALWPGPVDRWDDGNVVRAKLYGGALTSAATDAVLNGANAFAIEAGGEWEIVQARSCVLVGAQEYELSGFLRGRLGSAHAMGAPHPVGARIVALDHRLARLDVGAHEWNESLAFSAPPSGAVASDARALAISATLPHAALRAWAPAHLNARRVAGDDVQITWVRCARIGGDAWGVAEPPLGAGAESYRLDIFDGDDLLRSATIAAPAYVYSAGDQIADFGLLPPLLRFQVAQMGDGGATGLNSELTITL